MAGTSTAIGTSIVSSVLPPILSQAGSLALDQYDIWYNIKREIMYLQSTLNEVSEILEKAEEMQINNNNVRELLIYLVDIAYEARDELDDFITSASTISTRSTSRSVLFNNCLPISFLLNWFHDRWSSSVQVVLPFTVRCRVAWKIRSIRNRLANVMKQSVIVDISQYVSEREKSSESVPKIVRPESSSLTDKQSDLLVGREGVKRKIMEKLLDKNNNHVQLVEIWGMGGVGKTTLAQHICNDDRVKCYHKRWFPVGGKLNCKEIISKISEPSGSIDVMQRQVVENLNGFTAESLDDENLKNRRFLIVLDDVWEVDIREWDLLWNPLTQVENGGMIIVTTRIGNVITASNTQVQHTLLPLSYEDCWRIFESHAFVGGKSDNKPALKCIGREIVKKLQGLPLAAKVVGRSLFNEPNEKIWEDFLHAREWKLMKKDGDVMLALRLSYKRLCSSLKRCFAYCALYPKAHVLDEKILVEMWMAHDLIQFNVGERPEDIGSKYFKELTDASLFQYVNKRYVMHDLIRDLALHVSNEEFSSAVGSLLRDQMEKVRHITITNDDEYSKNLSLCKSKRILTVYTPYERYKTSTIPLEKDILLEVFKQSKSLRVLVLCNEGIKEIPDCISELKHLRYLDVSRTGVNSLPDSLCRLYNLQMIAAPPDVVLPRDVVNMVNLRYIRASLSTCEGVGKLTSLQELSSIHVCEGDNIRELGDMQSLRGKLRIEGLENVSTLEGDVAALMEKQTLMDKLELKFHQPESTISAQVLDALGCPPNLTHLWIAGYNGRIPPSWMVDGKHKFDKLRTLELHDFPKLESLPPLGELTSLKHLYLLNVGVKRLRDEFYGKFTDGKVFFPSLESLKFFFTREWEEWDDIIIENSNVSFFPYLAELEIRCCPELVSVLPVVKNPIMNAANFMTSLSKLVINNCSKLVSVLPVVKNPIMNAANFMTSLSNLRISWSNGLKRLQLDALVSLKELDISYCKRLVQITSARSEKLRISSCRPLEKMDVARFDSLVVIKILKLQGCESLRSLSIDTHGLDSLERLEIIDCPKLESLPPLGELTSLKHIHLEMVGVKRLGDEFYRMFTNGKVFFPSLESLIFNEMYEWEE